MKMSLEICCIDIVEDCKNINFEINYTDKEDFISISAKEISNRLFISKNNIIFNPNTDFRGIDVKSYVKQFKILKNIGVVNTYDDKNTNNYELSVKIDIPSNFNGVVFLKIKDCKNMNVDINSNSTNFGTDKYNRLSEIKNLSKSFNSIVCSMSDLYIKSNNLENLNLSNFSKSDIAINSMNDTKIKFKSNNSETKSFNHLFLCKSYLDQKYNIDITNHLIPLIILSNARKILKKTLNNLFVEIFVSEDALSINSNSTGFVNKFDSFVKSSIQLILNKINRASSNLTETESIYSIISLIIYDCFMINFIKLVEAIKKPEIAAKSVLKIFRKELLKTMSLMGIVTTNITEEALLQSINKIYRIVSSSTLKKNNNFINNLKNISIVKKYKNPINETFVYIKEGTLSSIRSTKEMIFATN